MDGSLGGTVHQLTASTVARGFMAPGVKDHIRRPLRRLPIRQDLQKTRQESVHHFTVASELRFQINVACAM